MIVVEMTRPDRAAKGQPLCEVGLDLTIAGQARERIGLLGCLDLLRGDMAKQGNGAAHSKIATIAGDDEIVALPSGGSGGNQSAPLLESRAGLDLHGVAVGHADDRLPVVDLWMEWA